MEQTWLGRIKAKERREAAVEALQRALVGLLQTRFPDASESIVAGVERIRKPADLEELISRAGTATK
jgi:hypothetical protein